MVDLPSLHYYSGREKASASLKGYVLILIQHLLRDAKFFLQALEAVGADKERMFVIGIPYSSKEEIVKELGQEYHVYSPTSYPFDDHVEDALSKALEMCKQENLSLLIIEDGGYAVPLIHEKFLDSIEYCKGAVEQTTNGIWRDEDLVLKRGLKFKFPIVSIPDCKLKKRIESPFIGKAVVGNILNLISEIGLFIEGKRVGVIGCGNIGEKIAKEAKKQDVVNVSVSEIDPITKLAARIRGFDTKSITDLVKECDLIIGATGGRYGSSIGRSEILGLKNNSILASASSKRVEIDVEELENLSATKKPLKIGTWYELINGNKVLLIANGFPVNFFSSESVPDKIIDVILTLMFLSSISIAKGEIYLFSFALNFKRDLETKSLSYNLKKIFSDNECPLNDNINITNLDDSKWEINDDQNRYVIKECDGWLNVYEEPKLKIYRCSVNEYEIAELFHDIHF